MTQAMIKRLEPYKDGQVWYSSLIGDMQQVLPLKRTLDRKSVWGRNLFTWPLKNVLGPKLWYKPNGLTTKWLYKILIHMLNLEDRIKLSPQQSEPDMVNMSIIYDKIENFKSKWLQQRNN